MSSVLHYLHQRCFNIQLDSESSHLIDEYSFKTSYLVLLENSNNKSAIENFMVQIL